jgi:group I intron endonuclease
MVYVGQTNDMTKRLSVHKTRSKTRNTKLYQAMRKHGFENFKVKLLDYAGTKKDADMLEQMYIGMVGNLNTHHVAK